MNDLADGFQAIVQMSGPGPDTRVLADWNVRKADDRDFADCFSEMEKVFFAIKRSP